MKRLLFLPVAALAAYAPSAFAALSASPIKPPSKVSVGSGGITGVICLALQWLFTGAIIFSIILALLAAYDYMRSSGDPAKVKSATNRLVYVAIGVAVAIFARSLPVLVGSVFGAGSSGDTSAFCR